MANDKDASRRITASASAKITQLVSEFLIDRPPENNASIKRKAAHRAAYLLLGGPAPFGA
jgi:hypothetical protein